jgi:hypothetical protein
MWKRRVPVAAALAGVFFVFLVGLAVGSTGVAGVHPRTMTGNGQVGAEVATLWSGDTAFGFRSSVPWRDGAGAEHSAGWPACLAPGEAKGVRFTGAVVWNGDSGPSVGHASVLWVDCEGR